MSLGRSYIFPCFGVGGSDHSFGHPNEQQQTNDSYENLKFHPVHGTEVTLTKDGSVAERSDEDFQNSIVFSDRPVRVKEVVGVKITKANNRYCGPLKIGFTRINPATFQGKILPTGLQLLQMPEVCLRAILLHEIYVGCTVHFTMREDGAIFHAVNGKELGMIMLDRLDTSEPLWAIVEVYGSVKGFKLVDTPYVFTFNENPFARKIEVAGQVDENGNTVEDPSSSSTKEKLAKPSKDNWRGTGCSYSQFLFGKHNGNLSHHSKPDSSSSSPSAPPLTPFLQSPRSPPYRTPMSSPGDC